MQLLTWFKKLILISLCSITMVGYAATEAAPVFHDLQGNTLSVNSFKDKWVVVTYWSTWCASCSREIPELNRFYQNNRNKNVLFYGVNFDQLAADDLKVAASKSEIAFPLLVEDPNRQAWQLGDIEWLPVTFIINPQGKVVKKIVGKNTEQTLMNTLNQLQGIAQSKV